MNGRQGEQPAESDRADHFGHGLNVVILRDSRQSGYILLGAAHYVE
jgi:hypothetical protein